MDSSNRRPVKLHAPATGDYTGGLFAFVLVAAVVVGALFAISNTGAEERAAVSVACFSDGSAQFPTNPANVAACKRAHAGK